MGPVPYLRGAAAPGAAGARARQPVNVYRRDAGSTFEIEQRMTADGLVSCPTTAQRVERVLRPFTPRYKAPGSTRRTTGDPRTQEQP